MEPEVIYGFEIALPPDLIHTWTDYVEFIPSDKDEVLLTLQDDDFTVKREG